MVVDDFGVAGKSDHLTLLLVSIDDFTKFCLSLYAITLKISPRHMMKIFSS